MGAVRLISICCSISSVDSRSYDEGCTIPALCDQDIDRAEAAHGLGHEVRPRGRSATSVGTVRTSAPVASSPLLTRPRSSAERAASTRRTPRRASASAIGTPIRARAPVMIATLPRGSLHRRPANNTIAGRSRKVDQHRLAPARRGRRGRSQGRNIPITRGSPSRTALAPPASAPRATWTNVALR